MDDSGWTSEDQNALWSTVKTVLRMIQMETLYSEMDERSCVYILARTHQHFPHVLRLGERLK
jgi:hypothetical protein